MSYIQDSINPTRGLQQAKCPKCGRRIKFYIRQTWVDHVQNCDGKLRQIAKKQDIACHFCGGCLGAIEKQNHPNPDFAEFRTCLKCGYQWAKRYWKWLAKEQGVDLK